MFGRKKQKKFKEKTTYSESFMRLETAMYIRRSRRLRQARGLAWETYNKPYLPGSARRNGIGWGIQPQPNEVQD